MTPPLLIAAVLSPLLGAVAVLQLADQARRRTVALLLSALSLGCSVAAWLVFCWLPAPSSPGWAGSWLALDQLSAPLLPLSALLFTLTGLVTPRGKLQRFSFARALVLQSLTLATLACREPWGIVALLVLGMLPLLWELRSRGQSSRLILAHLLLCSLLLVLGQWLEDFEGADRFTQWWAALPLLTGVLIRCGVAPFHLWVGQLFDRASFGLALLFVTPLPGAYACVRLVLPIAPDWMLRGLALSSVFTALYCGALALVQRDGRRLFSCLLLSHSAQVLVGLEMVTDLGLTGALCLWLSVSLSLAAFALVLRAVESRQGSIDLSRLSGLYSRTPTLALSFVLTGLACVGFPGTSGFVATELLFDGVVEAYPFSGAAVVIASALNGIAIIRAYFLLFAGTASPSSVSLQTLSREQSVLLTLSILILLGGFFPQPGVQSRHNAALEILSHRDAALVEAPPHSLDSTGPHTESHPDAPAPP